MLFDALCYALSGFFMKFSDEAMDTKNNKVLAIITGLLCVFFTVLVCATSMDAVFIFVSILIGTALAKKVDSINHIISAIIFILLLYIIAPQFWAILLNEFGWIWLMLCIIAAYIDEKGNDFSDNKEENNEEVTLVDKFFKYRYALKVTVLIISLIGLLFRFFSITRGIYLFNPMTFICFYLFDLSYEFVGLYFDRFYDLF
ncbi:hypothetical protein [uncultured Methanosphaera sp.]|uniref:hypothetical protein n=1 Tax=uncultured Methanosphaera sp. TaxID=262501 RepID=UPI0025945DA8|nr:hypothetical protein [uncultured Methanosphaera sp.]